jgi:hypothetical protein
VCGGESLVGDMGPTRGQVLGLPKKQKIEKTDRCRCAEVIRRRIVKARSSLGLSAKKGVPSVRRNMARRTPKHIWPNKSLEPTPTGVRAPASQEITSLCGVAQH